MKKQILFMAAVAVAVPMFAQNARAQQPPRAVRRNIPMTAMIKRAMQAGTRDSTGRPGRNYWQTSADYTINASLDPATSVVTGRETIVLHNNSPSAVANIRFRLDQNIFASNVERLTTAPEITDGMVVTKLAINGVAVDLTTPAARGAPVMGPRPPAGTVPTAFDFNTTNARVLLPQMLAPHSTANLEVEWHFRVPLVAQGRGIRMGRWADTLYQAAQWYPRVAVYDDYKGWDTEPYLGMAEFYNNFGHFDVTYDVPAGWIVASTGVLQNANEVLTQAERDRLAHVLASDSVVHIAGPDEQGAGKSTAPGTRLQWHFVADSVADVAWATAKNYVWDATRANIPEKGYVPVYVLYLPGHTAQFAQVPAAVRHALEFYSQMWMPYAFPQMTTVDGPENGMEYPMFIMSGLGAADHETGHEWWPMMVGVNETWWGFMDEGFNQYQNILSANDRQHRPRSTGLDGPGSQYGRISGDENEAPLIWNENYAGPMYGFTAYGKAPMMLSMLGGIVGDSAVWRAQSAYAKAWRFKHPTPWDYAFFMNNALHQDLGWFWYYWMWTTEAVDESIQSVVSKGSHTIVTVRQDGEMPSPVVLQVHFTPTGAAIKPMKNSVMVDDSTAEVSFPVNVWFNGNRTYDVDLAFGGRQITSIVLDPHQRFPDNNTKDNLWPKPVPVTLSEAQLERYVGTYSFPTIGLTLDVTRNGTQLFAQPPGQREVSLVPVNETTFDVAEVDAQLVFQLANGKTTGLVLKQNGQEFTGQKTK